MHHRDTTFEITFDFVDHLLVAATADGRRGAFALRDGLSVADFDRQLHALLAELGVDVEIKEEPFGVPMTTPFAADSEHASWDRDAVERCGRILDWSDAVLEEFSGWFCGKTSPVHVFWHSFDLAMSRFSGRPAPALEADAVTQEAYSREVISFGFWAGDDNLGDAAYYSYTAPEPDGLREQPLTAGEWIEYRRGLAGDPALRARSHRPRSTDDAARVLPERLRGRGPTRRLGHRRLRVGLVPDTEPAQGPPRQRGRDIRPRANAAGSREEHVMTDERIADRIERLVAEEHELRTREQAERNDDDALVADRARLSEIAVELDRCWDVLRQRRALRGCRRRSRRRQRARRQHGRELPPVVGNARHRDTDLTHDGP